MRVIIIEPFLKNQMGHQFFYVTSIQAELEIRGIQTYIFGNKDADSTCLKINKFSPCLSAITNQVLDFTRIIWKIPFKLLKLISIFQKQLVNCLLNNPHFKINQQDIFFFPTVYIFELIPLAFFLKHNRRTFQEHKNRIIIFCRFRYIRDSKIGTFILGSLYKFLCNVLLRRLNSRIEYVTDSELLKLEYEQLLGRELKLFPIPIPPLLSNVTPEVIIKGGNVREKKRVTIAFLGAARYNKGYDVAVKLIQRLYPDTEFQKKVFWIIQTYISSQPSRDRIKVLEAQNSLELCARKSNNIRLISGTVSMEDYYKLLLQSDILLLPYRGAAFKSATSNIFVESIVSGKIPIVSSHTWMAYNLRKYGLEDFVFDIGAEAQTAALIRRVVEHQQRNKVILSSLRDRFKNFHTSRRLVDALIG